MAGLTQEDAEALEAAFKEPDEETPPGEPTPPATPPAEGAVPPPAEPPEPDPAGASGEGTPPPSPPSQEGTPPPATVKVGDREVPLADLEALVEFQGWAAANPDKMQAFGSYLNGDAEFVLRKKEEEAKAAEEAAKIDWDTVDPQIKAAWDQQQAQLAEVKQNLDQLQNPIQQWQQSQIEEVQRQANDSIAQATKLVTDKFALDLTPQEVDELHKLTADLNILPGLRASIANPVEAVATALEMAVFRTDKYRAKIVDAQVVTQRANDKRQLAGTVTGSGGSERAGVESSAGDTSEADRKLTPEQRQRAMAAEIAEYQKGTL